MKQLHGDARYAMTPFLMHILDSVLALVATSTVNKLDLSLRDWQLHVIIEGTKERVIAIGEGDTP